MHSAGVLHPGTMNDQMCDGVYADGVVGAFAALLDTRAERVFNVASGGPGSMRECIRKA